MNWKSQSGRGGGAAKINFHVFNFHFSANRFLGEVIHHQDLDSREGHWQVDAYFMGWPGQQTMPTGQQQWSSEALPRSRSPCHGEEVLRVSFGSSLTSDHPHRMPSKICTRRSSTTIWRPCRRSWSHRCPVHWSPARTAMAWTSYTRPPDWATPSCWNTWWAFGPRAPMRRTLPERRRSTGPPVPRTTCDATHCSPKRVATRRPSIMWVGGNVPFIW